MPVRITCFVNHSRLRCDTGANRPTHVGTSDFTEVEGAETSKPPHRGFQVHHYRVIKTNNIENSRTSRADGNEPLNLAPASMSLSFKVRSASFTFICFKPTNGLGLDVGQDGKKARKTHQKKIPYKLMAIRLRGSANRKRRCYMIPVVYVHQIDSARLPAVDVCRGSSRGIRLPLT